MEIVSDLNDEHSSSQCIHPSFIDNKCTSCNQCIINCGNLTTIKFSYIHPKLMLSLPEINQVRQDNLQSLFERKKLNLVLDLDHTLVHTMTIEDLNPNEKENIEFIEDVYKFTFPESDYVIKLRPGANDFLNQVSSMFDLSVYTLGSRDYANKIVEILGGLTRFSWVITRDDCINEMKKSFDNILSYSDVSLIVDDSINVWDESCKENIIPNFPYYFFPNSNKSKDIDKDLDRVFNILCEVYSTFYNVDCDYRKKDVKEILKQVLMKLNNVFSSEGSHGLDCLDQEQIYKDTKEGESYESSGSIVYKMGPKRLRLTSIFDNLTCDEKIEDMHDQL